MTIGSWMVGCRAPKRLISPSDQLRYGADEVCDGKDEVGEREVHYGALGIVETVAVYEECNHCEHSEENAHKREDENKKRGNDVTLGVGEVDSSAVWPTVIDPAKRKTFILNVRTYTHFHGTLINGRLSCHCWQTRCAIRSSATSWICSVTCYRCGHCGAHQFGRNREFE